MFAMISLRRLSALLILCCAFACSTNVSARKPNIVLIVADDLGYGDLGCYGNPTIKTPHIDRMAAEGLRFTEFSMPQSLCTPSRAAFMTGRLAIRTGMAGGAGRHVLYPYSTGGLPTNEITIATALKGKGYATACIGKWHLGHLPQFLPTSHGFDYYYGIPYSNDMDSVSPAARKADTSGTNPKSENFNVPLMRNEQIIERPTDQSLLTKRITEESVRFIQENKKKPFFLYVPHVMPHVPLFASKEFRGKSIRGLYGDTVEEIDWSVGQILETLRKEKLSDDTLVFFTSDNGPWLEKKLNGGSAGLLRDGKGGTWEGGFRVPAIAWWPGSIKERQTTMEWVNGLDLYPTFLALGGAEVPKDRPIDAVDFRDVLFGKGPSKRETQAYYYGDQLYAFRKGLYKAHFVTDDGYTKEPAVKHEKPLLFHLRHDPSEKINIAGDHPEIVADIEREAEKHRASIVPGKQQF
jgi:arylsulfatase A